MTLRTVSNDLFSSPISFPTPDVVTYEFTDDQDRTLVDSDSGYTIIGSAQTIDLSGAKYLGIRASVTLETGSGGNYNLHLGIRIASNNYWMHSTWGPSSYSKASFGSTYGTSDYTYLGLEGSHAIDVVEASVPTGSSESVEIVGGFGGTSKKLKGATGRRTPSSIFLAVYR